MRGLGVHLWPKKWFKIDSDYFILLKFGLLYCLILEEFEIVNLGKFISEAKQPNSELNADFLAKAEDSNNLSRDIVYQGLLHAENELGKLDGKNKPSFFKKIKTLLQPAKTHLTCAQVLLLF